jgi:hypothetical protein
LNQLSSNDLKLAERAIFKIQTIHNQFYTSLLFREKGILAIKYDTNCMNPINDSAKKVAHLMREINPDVFEISWSGDKAIIIDNWKMLHGRREVNAGEKRELRRIYIN